MMLGARTAALGGGRDSYDYQVDYVGCNNGGTKLSYFDSGVKLNVQTDEVEIKYLVSNYPNASNGGWGNYNEGDLGLYYFGEVFYWNRVNCCGNGEGDTTAAVKNGRVQLGSYRVVKASKNIRKIALLYEDWTTEYPTTGRVENSVPVTSSHQFEETCPIMAVREKGVMYNNYLFWLHSFSIKRNGIFIRDFIPVVKNDVGYLFDNVEGKLYPMLGNGVQVIGNRVDVAA